MGLGKRAASKNNFISNGGRIGDVTAYSNIPYIHSKLVLTVFLLFVAIEYEWEGVGRCLKGGWRIAYSFFCDAPGVKRVCETAEPGYALTFLPRPVPPYPADFHPFPTPPHPAGQTISLEFFGFYFSHY